MLKIPARYPVLRTWPVFLNCCQVTVRVHVTGTRTVSEFAYRIAHIGVLVLLMWVGLIVAPVAAGTIRLKCREPPGDGFGIRLMASRARQIDTVIKWFVSKHRVAELIRQPGVGVVACIAFPGRHKVTGITPGCDHAIVARRTGAQNLVVVYGENRHPCCRRVAIFTDIGR